MATAPSQALLSAAAQRETEVSRAKAELADLRAQDPRKFLEIFDVMRGEGKDPSALGPLRHVTEQYISTRGVMIERVLKRFIDEPNPDLRGEFERLESLAAEYRRELDWYAERVPDVANLDEILETTTLKLPSFVSPSEAQATSAHQLEAFATEASVFTRDIQPNTVTDTL